MTKKIGFQTTGPESDSYIYIETAIGKSYAIGSDNLTNSLCINSSPTPGILPDESTSLITLSPQPNTDIDLAPNGTGNVTLLNGNLRMVTGTTVYSSFDEGALVTDSTGVTSTVTGTEGYVLTANASGTAPSFQPASGGSSFTWNLVTDGSVPITMVPNNGYVVNTAPMMGENATFVLPVSSSFGDEFAVVPIGSLGTQSGGWIITQNDGQVIHFGLYDTTVGSAGSLASGAYLDSGSGTTSAEGVRFLTVVDNTEFTVLYSFGNIIVT